MVETAGGCAIVAQNSIVNPIYPRNRKNPYEAARDNRDTRAIVREEIRRHELEEKAKTGDLTEKEELELAALKTKVFLDGLPSLKPETICYVA